MVSVEIIISGKVQGVWFRKHTKRMAEQLRVMGTVRNEATGNVRVQAQGTDSQIEEFIAWCKVGSPQSRVDKVTVNDIDSRDRFNEFNIVS